MEAVRDYDVVKTIRAARELRTPVSSLKALVETLEAGPDFLRRMHVEVDGLAHLRLHVICSVPREERWVLADAWRVGQVGR